MTPISMNLKCFEMRRESRNSQ